MEEGFFKVLMILSTLIVMTCLIEIIMVILIKGGAALSLEMLTSIPKAGAGKEGGGILNAIVGSILLGLGATLMAFIFSVGIAIYLQKDYSSSRMAELVRMVLDILWGIPSIIYGVFCFVIMINLGIGSGLLAGIIALTLLEIPIMTRAMDESLQVVPKELKEASYSLGLTRFEVLFKVIRKQAFPGIMSGILLAFGRAIGDAASVYFTAGYSDYVPTALSDSAASLPTMIFALYNSPMLVDRQRAYAAAFVLLMIVLITSIISRYIGKRYTRYIIK